VHGTNFTATLKAFITANPNMKPELSLKRAQELWNTVIVKRMTLKIGLACIFPQRGRGRSIADKVGGCGQK